MFKMTLETRKSNQEVLQYIHYMMGGTEEHGVHLTSDGIEVSPFDKREYKLLNLPNGLQALVVSDPSAESGAAALDVHVGFHSDPDEVPGLAHFCEHMLFLGTEKYPDENSYTSFLSDHGGSSNAFTSARDTNFYFDVGVNHLHEALDRFAQFFISPLFTLSATDREMKAIDSENANNLQDDYWRLNQLQRSLGNPKHPHGKYGVGNIDTLDTIPKQKGLNVRQMLLDFHRDFYSANLMKLVVYGNQQVDTLAQWVKELFSLIPTTNRLPPMFGMTSNAFIPEQHCGRRLDVFPIKDLKMIEISWMLPSLRSRDGYSLQHTGMIGHLLGHEGSGSLLSFLKLNKWVQEMEVGVEEDHEEYAIFTVSMDVTEEGIVQVDNIVVVLFQFLNLLWTSPWEEWMFKELQQLGLMHFLFQSQQSPMNTCVTLASSMQRHVAIQHLFTQKMFDYSFHQVKEIKQLLNVLKDPKQMNLTVVCKSFEQKTIKKEKYYGTKYFHQPLSLPLLTLLEDPPLNDQLFLPHPNQLIPNEFTLVNTTLNQHVSSQKEPTLLIQKQNTRVWYAPDQMFGLPKVHVALTFYCQLIDDSPLTYVLSDMFVQLVKDSLTEYAYDASLAGFDYNLSLSTSSGGQNGPKIHLGVVGYSQKIGVFIQEILTRCQVFHFQPIAFERVKETMQRAYENALRADPYQHAMQEMTFLLHENGIWRREELIQVLQSIRLEMVVFHGKKLWQSKRHNGMFLEGFFYGNLTSNQVFQLVETHIEPIIFDKNTNLSYFHHHTINRSLERRQICLPNENRNFFYCKQDPNPSSTNCAIDVCYQIGQETLYTRAVLAVFAQLVQEPLFHQLRTIEQLGYSIFSTPTRSGQIQYFRVIIQSNVAPPEYLEARLEKFWQIQMDNLLTQLDQVNFQKNLDAVMKYYTEKPHSQEEMCQFFLDEILTQQFCFDRKQKLAKITKNLTQNDLLNFFYQFIFPSTKRAKLSVYIYGNNWTWTRLLVQQEEDKEEDGINTMKRASTCVYYAMMIGTRNNKTISKQYIKCPHHFKKSMPLFPLPPIIKTLPLIE